VQAHRDAKFVGHVVRSQRKRLLISSLEGTQATLQIVHESQRVLIPVERILGEEREDDRAERGRYTLIDRMGCRGNRR